MPAFFTFTDELHDEINRQAADACGEPWPHLVLTVKPHHVRGFTVAGDRAYDMDFHHERAALPSNASEPTATPTNARRW